MGTARLTRLHDLLNEVFRGRERLTSREIHLRAGGMDLSPVLRRLVDTIPDGEYDRERAGAVLQRIQHEEGMWRDETRVPLSDLDRAMATSGTEGQFDDRTGHEAGPGEEFDERSEPGSEQEPRVRPSPEGPSGPH